VQSAEQYWGGDKEESKGKKKGEGDCSSPALLSEQIYEKGAVAREEGGQDQLRGVAPAKGKEKD